MQSLEALPAWAQVTLSVAVFLFTAFLHIRGTLKRTQQTGDVAIPSVTVANAQVIENMTKSLDQSNRLSAQQIEKDIEMRFELKRLSESTRENRDLLLRLLGEPRDRDRQRGRDRN